MRLGDIRIAFKLWIPVVLSAIGLLAIGGLALFLIRETMIEDRHDKVRNLTETAHGIAKLFHARSQAGEVTDAEARELTKSAIRAMRYDEVEYVFVFTMDGVTEVHAGKPALEGKNLIDLKDPTGFEVIRGLRDMVRDDGAGFLDYMWPKPGFERPVQKTSYAIEFQPWNWFIGTGIYLDDVDAAFQVIAMEFGAIFLGVVLVLGVIAFTFSRDTTRSIAALSAGMHELAAGNLDVEVAGADRRDEVGNISRAVAEFKQRAIERGREEAERQAAEQKRLEAEAKEITRRMADDFETQVSGIVESVSSAAAEMQASAESLSTTAEQTTNQSMGVSAASEEASTNVQTVAAAAEELSTSIAEIGRRVSESAGIARDAVKKATATNERVEGLERDAKRIGDVSSLIADIAEQTNLLALNATIEAARAGDAGKGFAVVASEVKNLANQTAKATEDIASQIAEIQSSTRETVEAIQGIGTTIDEINEITSAIAAAVEQQGAATQEIARNVEQAASGTDEVSRNIVGVNEAAQSTGAASSELLGAAKELSRNSETLKVEVSRFLTQVRAS